MNKFRGTAVPISLNVIIGLAVSLSGCMVGPDYRQPEAPVPQNWLSSASLPAVAAETTTQQAWWQSFNDPILNRLIEKAAGDNPDLKIAEVRIAESRAARASAYAALLPVVNITGNASRQGNQLGFPSGGPSDLSNLVKQPFNIFKSGFDASWELDLFGGRRRELESAAAEYEASTLSRQDMLISTLAEVARTYVDIRLYRAQLAITQETLDADRKTAAIARQRFDAGGSPGIEVAQAEAQVEHANTQLPYFSNLLAQAEYGLDVLLGEQPGAAHAMVGTGTFIPVSDAKLLLAAPAAVIANRPDIRNAERKLAAATAQQGVAVAKFFPDVSLSGFIGLFNTNAGNFLSVGSKSWNMGGNILWPILSYGALSANLEAADAKRREAMAIYQKSVLGALSDVERSCTAYIEQEKHLRFQEQAVAADRHVLTIAQERYEAGMTSFMEVLDAERSLQASENQLAQAMAQTSRNLIAVYKSIGGGWKPAASAQQLVNDTNK